MTLGLKAHPAGPGPLSHLVKQAERWVSLGWFADLYLPEPYPHCVPVTEVREAAREAHRGVSGHGCEGPGTRAICVHATGASQHRAEKD